MIAVASDHAGFEYKNLIIKHLTDKNIPCEDLGTFDTTSVDYNDFGEKVGEAVSKGIHEKGIIICGTGIGISISANKVPGVRAALCTNSLMAKLSRDHNDANVLALGARIIGPDLALDIVDTWLGTPFSNGERHTRRVGKFSAIEKRHSFNNK